MTGSVVHKDSFFARSEALERPLSPFNTFGEGLNRHRSLNVDIATAVFDASHAAADFNGRSFANVRDTIAAIISHTLTPLIPERDQSRSELLTKIKCNPVTKLSDLRQWVSGDLLPLAAQDEAA